MKKSELKQIIKEEYQNQNYTFRFSQYNSELPKEIRQYVKSKIKEKYPKLKDEIIEKYIHGSEDWHYEKARKENKIGRDYPEININDYIDDMLFNLEDMREV